MLKITLYLFPFANYNKCVNSKLVRIKPKTKEDIIMLTIKLDPKAFNHKDQIISRLEDEIRDLALCYEYKVVQDDFTSVDYPRCEYDDNFGYFATKVHHVLVRIIDECVRYNYDKY